MIDEIERADVALEQAKAVLALYIDALPMGRELSLKDSVSVGAGLAAVHTLIEIAEASITKVINATYEASAKAKAKDSPQFTPTLP